MEQACFDQFSAWKISREKNGLTKVQLQVYNAFSSILQLLDRPLMYTKHIETSFSFKPYCLLVVNAKKNRHREAL